MTVTSCTGTPSHRKLILARRFLLSAVDPRLDRARVREHRAVGQLEGGQLRVPGRLAQRVARSLAQERDRVAVRRDHLLVVDARRAERLLDPAAGMDPGAAVVAVAHEQGRDIGHGRLLGGLRSSLRRRRRRELIAARRRMRGVYRAVALPALLLALAPFHSSVRPLPQPVRTQLKGGGFWHRGCPVALSGLRLLTVTNRGFDGHSHTGQLVVNRRAARPLGRASAGSTRRASRSTTCGSPTSTGPRAAARATATRPPRSNAARRCRPPAPAAGARGRGPCTPTASPSTSTRSRTPTSAAARLATRRRDASSTARGTGAGWWGGVR